MRNTIASRKQTRLSFFLWKSATHLTGARRVDANNCRSK